MDKNINKFLKRNSKKRTTMEAIFEEESLKKIKEDIAILFILLVAFFINQHILIYLLVVIALFLNEIISVKHLLRCRRNPHEGVRIF